ncbi:MAG: TAXI family TRAP transporter solute-binding subunit [Candidatus Methylomirabilota bacterium]
MRVNRSLGWLLVAALLALGLAAGPALAGQAAFPKPKAQNLVFASGPQGGSWLPVSAAIGELIRKNIPGSVVTVQPGGGTTNIKLVERGDSQLGVTNSTSLYEARKGLKPFEKPYTKIRALANIYPQTFQMMVLADAGIKEVEDVVGKRYIPAGPGQSTYDVNAAVLDIHGLTFESLKAKGTKLTLTSAQGQANDMLKDKQIDAVWWATACPSPGIVDVSLARNVSFVGLRDDKLKQFVQKYPQFARSTIPAGTYKGQTKEVQTIGWFTTFYASTDMSDDVAYWIVKSMWEGRKDLVSTSALLSFIDLPTVATGVQIELHPGAKKFYQEIGAKID